VANNESLIMICNYAVVWLDILGQKNSLNRFPKILRPGMNSDLLQPSLEETYRKVSDTRNTIRQFFQAVNNEAHDDGNNEIPKEIRMILEQMEFPEIKIVFFGDAVIIYSKLTNESGRFSSGSIYAMIYGCALSLLVGFSRGIALRGAIEIGIGADWPEFGMYGSALFGAYELESTIAGYPRVVLGKELIDFLSEYKNNSSVDPVWKNNQQLANKCFSIMCEDRDGRPIVDFLSPNMPTIIEHSMQDSSFKYLKTLVKEGFQFVKKEYTYRKQKKDTKLAWRYSALLDYYTSRLHGWDLSDDMS
jgi:hypothetical protein